MKSAKLAKQLMERCQGRCEICGKHLENCAHAHRLVWGGAYVLENVMNLCYFCYMIKIHGIGKTMKIRESQLSKEQIDYIISKRSREYKYIDWNS